MKFILFGLLFCFLKSNFIAQRNSFRYQTGLAHCFFDGTPIVNDKDRIEFAESQYLNRSNGFQFQRILDNGTRFQLDMLTYNHFYRIYNFENLPAVPDSILFPMLTFLSRKYLDIQFCFLRNKTVNKALSYQYGIGPNFRFATYRYAAPIIAEPGPGPVHSSSSLFMQPLDIGASIRAEIAYSPIKWLTFFSQVNFVSLFFRFDDPFYFTTENLKPAPFKPLLLRFPSRFDFSLRVGVGINF